MMAQDAMTTSDKEKPPHHWLDCLGLACRLVLAVLFIYMGLTKAMHPELFLKQVRQYELTSNSLLLNSIAAALPWFEVFCGLMLMTGVGVRGTALLILLMLIPFTIVVFRRAVAISDLQHMAFCAVRFDCGCGGGEVLICRKLAENCVLMLLACGPLAGYGSRFAARFSLLSKIS
jgi:uncharacterized membrane protein YphA (DoxX/SURF4 family)